LETKLFQFFGLPAKGGLGLGTVFSHNVTFDPTLPHFLRIYAGNSSLVLSVYSPPGPPPPWWNTYWYVLLISIASSALLVVMYRRRKSQRTVSNS
jgi:hypothetical protein